MNMTKKQTQKKTVKAKKKAPKPKKKLSAITLWRIGLIKDEHEKLIKTRELGGRPPCFETPEELMAKVVRYFENVEAIHGRYGIPTKAGLLAELGCSRDSYNEYKKKPEFSDTIKRAEKAIEMAWIERLAAPVQATGAIFYLKNAFAYKDQIHNKNEDAIKIDVNDKQYSRILKYVRKGGTNKQG